MYLTKQNAERYVGKTLRCNGKGLFHYYPLTVKRGNDGNYYYVDRLGTAIQVPDENDSFNSVHFDYAVKEETSCETH